MKNLIQNLIVASLFGVVSIYSQSIVEYPNFPVNTDSLGFPLTDGGIPLIADLGRNGQKEIIFCSFFDTLYGTKITVLKPDGTNYPGFPILYPHYINEMASGDIDGDGFLDIAIRADSTVDVINRFGSHLTGFPVNYPDGYDTQFRSIALYDLDHSGKLELITSRRGELTVFNFNGLIRNGWPKIIPGDCQFNPAIGDLDHDGYAEIIYTSFKRPNYDSGNVNILRHNGSEFNSSFPIYYDSTYRFYPGSPSLVLQGGGFFLVSAFRPYSNFNQINKITKYSFNGVILARTYLFSEGGGFGNFSIGDLNREGRLEYCTGNQAETLTLLDSNLNVLSGWPKYGNNTYALPALIGKLTSSNNLNIINVWNHAPLYTIPYGTICAYSMNSSPLDWSPLRPYSNVMGITLTDLNNDGTTELVAITRQTSRTYAQVFSFPSISFNSNDFPWPEYCHDRYHTNQYGFIPPDIIGIQPISTEIPLSLTLKQNYPNPFNPETEIEFGIPRTTEVKIIIYDILGRQVQELVNESLKAGLYKTRFNAVNFASGIYFYTLITDKKIITNKMVLIK